MITSSASQHLEAIQVSGDDQKQFSFNTGAGLGMEPILMDLPLMVKVELARDVISAALTRRW